jgi:hypothetical protein
MPKNRFVKVYVVMILEGAAKRLDGVYSSELLAHERIAELKRNGQIASIVDIAMNQKGGRA